MSGDYTKVIFARDGDAPAPDRVGRTLRWTTAADDPQAFRSVMLAILEGSLDRHDRWATATLGAHEAARRYLEPAVSHFVRDQSGWETAWDGASPVGLVQPLLYVDGQKEERPMGTIGYIGVVPERRGNGYILDLLQRATGSLLGRHVWRIFCDTDTENHPMISAFERLGYTRGNVRAIPLQGWSP